MNNNNPVNSTINEKTYSKVQFIGFAISTTPGNLTSIEEMSDDGRYLGCDNVNRDISDRISLLYNAIKSAYQLTSTDASILKIFVVPEFYFRGNKGAYYGKSADVFKTHFNSFINCTLSQIMFKDWLFVLGTLVSSEQRIDKNTEPTKSLYNIGDSLLDVYYRLHPKMTMQAGKSVSCASVKRMLKILDETDIPTDNAIQANADNSYASVLASALNYCDIKASINIHNRCYIVEGGTSNPRVIQVLKKYKSKEDFILNSIDENYTQSITRYPDIPEASEVKRRDEDDYSIFTYGGLTFGIDICLDHSRGRLMDHLKKNGHDYVDVQIITSCGMTVRENAVIAKTNGLVFNCDGEYVIEGGAENGEHCHTVLKTVKKCYYEGSPAELNDYVQLQEESKLEFKGDSELYPHEKYAIHVYPPQQTPNR